MRLKEFFGRMDQLEKIVSLDRMRDWLSQLDVPLLDLEGCICFAPEQYVRNLIHRTPYYEALVLCFEAGQRTPIHDHAGSICGVKILSGTGAETLFDRTKDGWIFATGTRPLAPGQVLDSVDQDVHQLSNLQSDNKRLVTLHIYSPPLATVGNYSLADNRVIPVRPLDNDRTSVVFENSRTQV